MATTTPLQTLIDLDAAHTDGGHLGRYLHDALNTGSIRAKELEQASLSVPVDTLLEMATEGVQR